MHIPIKQDLWTYLKETNKPIVMYGMGNGADKILAALGERGIEVADFFASNGFVRGHSFHGKTVLSYDDVKKKYGAGNFIVLLSFASSLHDVIAQIEQIASETELYAPDIPVVLNEQETRSEVFDLTYFKEHEAEFKQVDALFADERSRELLRDVISYRLSGEIPYLLDCIDDRDTVYRSLLSPEKYIRTADLGAYNGDTARELLPYAPNLREIYCMEPDPRSFKKLSAYAEEETRCRVIPLNYAVHDKSDVLMFESSGNRNATLGSGNPASKKREAVSCDSLSHLLERYGSPRIDYIKFDVEGAEDKAIDGCLSIIRRDRPELLVSLYHRREDLFALPLKLASLLDGYDFYLRRFRYIPAWDLNLYAIPK